MSGAEERHARYYLEYAQEHSGDWRWFDREWQQVQWAWDWACSAREDDLVLAYSEAMRLFQNMRGLRREQIKWFERGLTIARERGQRKAEGALTNNVAWCYQVLGESSKALALYQRALQIHRELDDRASQAVALASIAWCYDTLGDRHGALECYEEVLPVFRELCDLIWTEKAPTMLHLCGLPHDEIANTETVRPRFSFPRTKAAKVLQDA